MISIDYNNPDQITVEWVLYLDSLENPPVWLRDDYLSMRGMAFCSNRAMYNWLDRLADMKQALATVNNYDFRVDKF